MISIYFHVILSAFSTSHSEFASFLSLSSNALIKATIWHRHSLLIFLEAVWTMFVQLYSMFFNQERTGNRLVHFLHKFREHAQVRIMWLEFLFSFFCDISSLTRQMYQIGYHQCQQYTSLAFGFYFQIFCQRQLRQFCFGNTREFWPKFCRMRLSGTEFPTKFISNEK